MEPEQFLECPPAGEVAPNKPESNTDCDGSDHLNQGLAHRRPEVRNHAIPSRV